MTKKKPVPAPVSGRVHAALFHQMELANQRIHSLAVEVAQTHNQAIEDDIQTRVRDAVISDLMDIEARWRKYSRESCDNFMGVGLSAPSSVRVGIETADQIHALLENFLQKKVRKVG